MPAIVSMSPKKKKECNSRSPVDASAYDNSALQATHNSASGRELGKPMVESFEIECGITDEDSEPTGSGENCRKKIFPLDCCCGHCPWCDIIPGPFRIIVGWTHLWLFLGTLLLSIMMVWNIKLIIDAVKAGKMTQNYDFASEVATVIFVMPCLWYFISTIRQYDQDLREKKKEVEKKRQELVDDFLKILGSLDDFLGETLAKTLDTAELGFECKQREFTRFIEELSKEWGESMSSPEMLSFLRRFVLNWACIFAECSIDPLSNPRLIVSEEDLEKCKDLGSICNLIHKGSEEARAQFIATKRRQDSDLCKENRVVFEKMTRTGDMMGRVLRAVPPVCRGFSWIRFGCCLSKKQLLAQLGTGDGSFPKVVPFGCGAFVLLSASHISLIIAFFGFIGLIGVEVAFGEMNWSNMGVLGIVDLCLIIVLMKFEDIDLVCQLEREISSLKGQKETVLAQSDRMRMDWCNAQVCTDLWIYRTLPRLTLYSEIHCFIEHSASRMAQCQQNMDRANKTWETFEKRLPPMDEWRNDGTLEMSSKREFRDLITAISQKRNFEEVLDMLAKSRMPWEDV